MKLARVIGTVVATTQVDDLEGVKFLWLQPLDRYLEPIGEPLVAADAVAAAGPGELVYFVSSREAAVALEPRFVPVDHAILGIADAVEELEG